MKYKTRACRIESKGNIWSIFDLKSGHEFFRGKFNGGNERHIFGYVACFATLYDFLRLDFQLTGQALMEDFTRMARMVQVPSQSVSMRLHGEDKAGREIDIDLN